MTIPCDPDRPLTHYCTVTPMMPALRPFRPLLVAVLLGSAGLSTHAAQLYAGAGLSGVHAGVGAKIAPKWALRGELAGGLSLRRDGRREGLDYSGRYTSSRVGGFVDYYPFDGRFRLTGGVTANRSRVVLDGRGTQSSVNGKPVDLSNERFQLRLVYPRATPYVGIGWAHAPDQGGLGFFADVGLLIGRFKTEADTTLVGKFGITQADVDAEVKKVRDSINKLAVMPSVALGITYGF